MYWLGLDAGTSASRALLVDAGARVRCSFTAAHPEIAMPQPLWAEQNPDDWWRASQLAVRGVLAAAGTDASAIRAIGLSGQMHGLVLLDRKEQVIRPALIWCDQRTQQQVDSINAQIGENNVLRWTANPVLTAFTLPKLLWVREHEPQHFESLRQILLPKDYVRFRLTGEFATDVSDASGTALFDVAKRRWSESMVSRNALDRSILPKAYESNEVTGTVSRAAAEATGLREGTPVVAGAGDQAASAIGNGIVEPGLVSCTIGSSGVIFASLKEPAVDAKGRVHTFCHAIQGMWHMMAVTQAAGLSLQWFRDRFAPGRHYDDLTAEAALSPPGARGLFWLPYLMGERTPHLDAHARGAWIGLTANHARADLIRAILEGVCYSQKAGLEIVAELGAGPSMVRLSGGGARSAFWHQLFADILDQRVSTLQTQEGSAFGAALLALSASGEYGSVTEACRAAVTEICLKKPDPSHAQFYRAGYDIYKSFYGALRPAFRAIGKIDA